MPGATPGRQSWTGSGLDLHLDLDLGTRPRYALEEGLREAIRAGRLPAGTPLPSTRTLAADLALARGTVVEAYAQLTAEGWIASRAGSGTVVAGAVQSPAPAPPSIPAGEQPPLSLDLQPGDCDLTTFPRTAWAAASRRALAQAPHRSFGYDNSPGRIELRRELSGYLARTRGIRAEPEHLVITTGFTQSLSLTASALAAAGSTRLAMENPCMPFLRDVVRVAGQRAVPIPVDANGIEVARIPTGSGRPRAALVAPARQFPLGVSLSPQRRTELLAWARSGGGYVIEDDYDGEFRYDRQPVGAIQGMDPQHVIYAGTTSKTLAPGLRLGWLAVPDRLLAAVVEQKRLVDGQTATLTQLTMTELLRSGGYDRHIRRMRLHYRRRRDYLLGELARRAPGIRVDGIAAGFSVALRLPEGWDDRAVVRAAAGRGLGLHGLCANGYYAEGTEPTRAGLVVNYATPPDHAYPEAVAALAELLSGPQ
jgi:GntR family transcriptional regulator/MocR family aminotransferase